MLSIERTKELLNDPTLSDKEAEEIRDGLRDLAEIIYEKWQEDRKKLKILGSSAFRMYDVSERKPNKSSGL